MNAATPRQRYMPPRAVPGVLGVAGRWALHHPNRNSYRHSYRVLVYSLRRLGRESPAEETPARRSRG
jgi:hypothetical protein